MECTLTYKPIHRYTRFLFLPSSLSLSHSLTLPPFSLPSSRFLSSSRPNSFRWTSTISTPRFYFYPLKFIYLFISRSFCFFIFPSCCGQDNVLCLYVRVRARVHTRACVCVCVYVHAYVLLGRNGCFCTYVCLHVLLLVSTLVWICGPQCSDYSTRRRCE